MARRVLLCGIVVIAAWGTTRADAQESVEPTDAVYQKINIGDATVVQTILDWLQEAMVNPDKAELHNKRFAALHGATAFRLEEAGPMLVAIYQNPRALRTVRDSVADAAAAIRSPASKRFLQLLLNDADLRARSRTHVLTALTHLDDDAARQELFALYKRYLRAFGHPDEATGLIKIDVETLADAKLLHQLEALHEAETDFDTKEKIEATIDAMQINALPVDELWKIAEDADWANRVRRHRAIDALGESGTRDDIPRLESLKPPEHAPPGLEATAARRAFIGARNGAIVTIRRLHWREQTEPPPPLKDANETGRRRR